MERLQFAKENRSWTYDQLQRDILLRHGVRVSRRTMQGHFLGERPPKIEHLTYYADALGYPMEFFFELEPLLARD